MKNQLKVYWYSEGRLGIIVIGNLGHVFEFYDGRISISPPAQYGDYILRQISDLAGKAIEGGCEKVMWHCTQVFVGDASRIGCNLEFELEPESFKLEDEMGRFALDFIHAEGDRLREREERINVMANHEISSLLCARRYADAKALADIMKLKINPGEVFAIWR